MVFQFWIFLVFDLTPAAKLGVEMIITLARFTKVKRSACTTFEKTLEVMSNF